MSKVGMEACQSRGRGLLELIQDVHMVNTGAVQLYGKEEVLQDEQNRKTIRLVLDNWDDLTISPIYDGLVKLLAHTVLEETY